MPGLSELFELAEKDEIKSARYEALCSSREARYGHLSRNVANEVERRVYLRTLVSELASRIESRGVHVPL